LGEEIFVTFYEAPERVGVLKNKMICGRADGLEGGRNGEETGGEMSSALIQIR
jgi:hypothetical protein